MNGDGKLDLLVPDSNGTVVVYLGDGHGDFVLQSAVPIPPVIGGTGPTPPITLVLADFNHDGKLDFATSSNGLVLGNGDGTFQTFTNIMANPPWYGFAGIAVGDINNDGWPDLALTDVDYYIYNNNAYIMLNDHHGGFTQAPTTFGANPHFSQTL